MSSKHRDRREANTEATRALIIREGRKVFAKRGFNDASLAEIVAAARVTTGAVYHHFRDKKGLFQAIAESVEQEILESVIAAASSKRELWDQLLAGVDATLEISVKPDVQRIVFVDAPTVIGPAAWREIEMRFAFGVMQETLQSLLKTGVIRPGSAEMLASILLSGLIEAAKAVAQAKDKKAALAEARKTMSRIFASLRR